MADEDVTLGEVGRRVDRVEGRVEQGFSDLNGRFDMLARQMADGYVRNDLFDARCEAISARLSNLEGWQRWAVRLILGALILAVLAAVVGVGTTRT